MIRDLTRQSAWLVGLWLFLLVFEVLSAYISSLVAGKPITWYSAAIYHVCSFSLWIPLTPLILTFTAWIKRARLGFFKGALAHMPCIFVVMVLDAAGWIFCSPNAQANFPGVPRYSFHFVQLVFFQNLLWSFWMYWTMVGISYGIYYYVEVRQARLHAAELEGQLARAELQALKQQLRPHFLFNTLNSVSSLMHTDVEAADDMIGNLSSLLRLCLDGGEIHNVPLKDELLAVQLFIDIQQARFGDRFTVEMNVEPPALEAYVPHLILQPLVENAFRHGISRRAGAGLLRIRAERRNGSLLLQVADNGPGSGNAAGNTTQIGLRNTRARLQKLYGNRSAVKIVDSDRGFSVELEMPLEWRSQDVN
jgi:two-component system LytT family sensor kinase